MCLTGTLGVASFLGPFEAKTIINSTMTYTASNPALGYRAVGIGQCCGQHYYADTDGYTRADGDQYADRCQYPHSNAVVYADPGHPDAYLDMDAIADIYASANGADVQHTGWAGAHSLPGTAGYTGQRTGESICLSPRPVCGYTDGPGTRIRVPNADY